MASAPHSSSHVTAAIVGWAGVALHVVAGIPYLAAGLVAPLWAILVLWLLWAGLLGVALRLRRRRPWVTFFVPPVAVALLLGLIGLGEAVLGWQA